MVRRTSEGETGRVKEDLRCEACGKGYKHISSLAKHLWEHTPEWNVTKKLLISKHQQVQLLEAASILVGMNHDLKGNGYNRGHKGYYGGSTSIHGGPPPSSLKLLHKRGASDQLANLPSPFSPTSEHGNSNGNGIGGGTPVTSSANGSANDANKLLLITFPTTSSSSAIQSDSDNQSEGEIDNEHSKHKNRHSFEANHQYQSGSPEAVAFTNQHTQNGHREYQFKPHHPHQPNTNASTTVPASQYPLQNDIKQPTPVSPVVYSQPEASSVPSVATAASTGSSSSTQPSQPSTLNGNARTQYYVTNQ